MLLFVTRTCVCVAQVRNEELSELDALYRSVCFVEVRECRSEPAGKSNVLLQSFISRHRLQTSSLISDTHYITQSAGRICRALFEVDSQCPNLRPPPIISFMSNTASFFFSLIIHRFLCEVLDFCSFSGHLVFVRLL